MKNKLIILLLIFTISLSFASASTSFGDPIERDSYTISRSIIDREIQTGNIVEDQILIQNKRPSQMSVSATVTGPASEMIQFKTSGVLIDPENSSEIEFTIIAGEAGSFEGEIKLSGDISESIPVNLTITEEALDNNFLIIVEPVKKSFTLKEKIQIKLDVKKILSSEASNVSFKYTLKELNTEEEYLLESETRNITGSFQIKKNFQIPEVVTKGDYSLEVLAEYNGRPIVSSSTFSLRIPFLSIRLFGFLPLWLLFSIIGLIGLGIIGYIVVRKQIEKRKKYKMKLETKTLPKKGERTLWLGKVAEKNMPAYLEMDKLTTHCVVAGATGGGKSISAQAIIEEALLKNISIIVFDPTAQWSGMLRKCEDKKMMSFYPQFGLKPSDAKAFPGNVRQIKDARQVIDISKYMEPGHIQIFTLNKLDPSEMDTFVGSVIAQIFRSDPKEHPGLKTILVFDEVHRLLPKFGGSGEGFLQIERACREFRKWGLGVMLVSQVLSDFVGEIKANINTEVQMRTRDEADLNRLKTKYGEEVLQSLIKASVGVGMFVNSSYNKGKPYFVQFRPILHNTRRLSDEVLDKYNEYGDKIEDLEYQIEQLEAEKVDTFDIKMELKLVKDKLMTGNFTVVDIYLEGLLPRVAKEWDKIGKKPKKKELELIDEKEVKKSLEAAKKEREKIEKEEKSGKEKGDTEKKEEASSPEQKEDTKKPEESPPKKDQEIKPEPKKDKTQKPVETKENEKPKPKEDGKRKENKKEKSS